MAKLTVNIGTSANDRTGDNLRTAFNKINQNFDELYTTLGLDDNSLNLGAFEFTGSVMTTTDSSAITIDQSVNITSDLKVDGDITISNQGDSSQPIDGTDTAGWIEITIDGQLSYMPYYRQESKMANIQTINIGNLVNDGTGDDLRTAFEKVNTNFADLNDELTLNLVSVGNGESIFKDKTGSDLRFNSVRGGNGIQVQNISDTIVVSNTRSVPFEKIDTDSGTILSDTYQSITMQGTAAPESQTGIKDIEVTATGSSVKFKTIIPVTDYLLTYDFGFIGQQAQQMHAIQLALTASNIDFGTLTYDSDLDLDCGEL